MTRKLALICLVLITLLAVPGCVTRVVYRQPPAQTPPVYAPPAYEPPAYEPPASQAPPGAGPEVGMFYDDLAPYGDWVRLDGPGWVWHPRGVTDDWRPYTLGHWVYTDFGWTWASDEEFGWAAYHYGRWHHAPRYGWVWIPGTEWGPAWVTWNASGDWIGWAPLPWKVEWRAGIGLDFGNVDLRVAIAPAWWCFLPARHLTDPSPRRHFVPQARNAILVNVTRNVTNYTIVDNRVFNQGVNINVVSKAAGRAVPRFRVRQDDAARAPRGDRVQGQELVVFRPGKHRGHEPRGHEPRGGAVSPAPAPRGADTTPAPADSRRSEAQAAPPEPPVQDARPYERPSRYRSPYMHDKRKDARGGGWQQPKGKDRQETQPPPDGSTPPPAAPDDPSSPDQPREQGVRKPQPPEQGAREQRTPEQRAPDQSAREERPPEPRAQEHKEQEPRDRARVEPRSDGEKKNPGEEARERAKKGKRGKPDHRDSKPENGEPEKTDGSGETQPSNAPPDR